MNTKRIVITGGPGSGKTTLINYLESLGHTCVHEISREVIKKAQEDGIEQLFLTNPMLFSEKLLEGRVKQFINIPSTTQPYVFYDRGMPDVTAYMDYIGSHYPDQFEEPCHTHLYDQIFLLPPWKDIYLQDNERYENFEQATSIYNFLLKGYRKYGYHVLEVPQDTIENRSQHIIKKLNDLYEC